MNYLEKNVNSLFHMATSICYFDVHCLIYNAHVNMYPEALPTMKIDYAIGKSILYNYFLSMMSFCYKNTLVRVL
jgi:hypothetical protein